MIESTLAGLAAGIVAQRVTAPEAIVQRPQLDIEVNGTVVDLAQYDAVVWRDEILSARGRCGMSPKCAWWSSPMFASPDWLHGPGREFRGALANHSRSAMAGR